MDHSLDGWKKVDESQSVRLGSSTFLQVGWLVGLVKKSWVKQKERRNISILTILSCPGEKVKWKSGRKSESYGIMMILVVECLGIHMLVGDMMGWDVMYLEREYWLKLQISKSIQIRSQLMPWGIMNLRWSWCVISTKASTKVHEIRTNTLHLTNECCKYWSELLNKKEVEILILLLWVLSLSIYYCQSEMMIVFVVLMMMMMKVM